MFLRGFLIIKIYNNIIFNKNYLFNKNIPKIVIKK